MITAAGYSKDLSIRPEGIVITFGKDLVNEKGGLQVFTDNFERIMRRSDSYLLQKCKNKPKFDTLLFVYIIVNNMLTYRGNYLGHASGKTTIADLTGGSWSSRQQIEWPRVLIGGPVIKCPFERQLKGFQGFRYCTELF